MKLKKLLSFLLATAMTISLLPTFTLTASAATTTEKNITLGTSALSGYDSTNGYKYVYYGTYNNEAVKWRVLDMAYKYDKNDTSKTGMLVLSENALAQTAFGTNSTWNGSTAQDWCNSMYTSSFGTDEGTKEQDFILGTASTDNILSNDYLFFLSRDEARNSKYFPNDSNRIAYLNGNAVWWWLRSPDYDDYVDCVRDNGLFDYFYVKDDSPSARPAFNLNLSSVLFTSVKDVKAIDKGKIKKNENYVPDTDEKYEYKLTMLDTSRSGFGVDETLVTGSKGQQITLSYSGAKTDDNEYVSAMIMNDNDEVLYYGQLAQATAASGEVSFDIPSELDIGTYELRLFNEQINDDGETDFSSAFQKVTLNVLPKATFTKVPSAIQNLAYDGTAQALVTKGETNDGTVKYSLSENGTYSENIPTAKNADTYTVWYYIEGNDSHSDSDKASIEVTIAKADSQTTTTANKTVTYGETLTLTATVTKSARTLDYVDFYVGEGENAELLGSKRVTYTDGTHGTATLTIDTKQKQLKIGENEITAEYGGSVNLYDSDSDTITVTLEKKPVGLTWENCDNLVYDGNPKNVTATATGIENGDGEIGVTVMGGKETNANTHTAEATALTGTYAEYYKLPSEKTKSYNIKPLQIQVEWSTPQSFEYDGNAKNVTATVKNKVPSDNLVLTYKDNEKTDAGNYTAEITGVNNTNYTLGTNNQALKQSWSITQAESSVTTVPTANTLTYDGTEQELVTSGMAKGGTLKYSLNNVDWTETIPTGTDATSYEVWYKVFGDANHTDTKAVNVDVTIAKKSIADATVALDGELTYNGQSQTQNVTLTLGGFTNVTFDVSANEQTNVKTEGDYTLTVTGTGNFTGTKTLDWNIKPYTPTEKSDKKTTVRVRRGRTLADATVTEGEILGINNTVLEGTFAWVDDTKAMSADGTEQMTFTPNEEIYGKNYATMTIDVAVSTYSSGGGGTSRYTVKFDTDGGNTITNQTVIKNSKATEPTEPTKEGYIFDGWYTDSKFTTKYDFDTKVTKNITLYAKWVEDEVGEPSDDKKDDEQKPTTDEWKNPFTDVTKADWFFDNVRYANENGLMSGTTDTTFAPNDNLTRAMLVTVLYRAEGEPAVNKSIPFADVNASQYYANAVIWAEQNGIVKGITETEFAPDENITREQIAAIIYRYAEYKGVAPTGAWAIKLDYVDVAEISDYAVDGVMYCTMKNIMQGKDNNMFAPKDNATRAEIAAILNRFIESNK